MERRKTGGVSNLTDIIATGVIAHGMTVDGRSVPVYRLYYLFLMSLFVYIYWTILASRYIQKGTSKISNL
jgi:hypothetical protein